jgi:capsular exopolysaccharide synthesis family protein
MVIANTAISFAQMGKKVLLIDGDLRCPVQHRVFNLDPKVAGLSELLAGVKKDISEVVRPSGVAEGLDVVTSGRIPPNPAELLASAQMVKFIEDVKEKYDVVFIDLPPICEVTDAGVISDLVTGYAFVIRAAYSDRNLIAIAVETMEGLGSSIVGFILNDVDIKSGDYYKNKYGNYGKYSKYGYGKYGKYGKYGRTGTDYRYGYEPDSNDANDKK